MAKGFNLFEKLEEISNALNSSNVYNAKFNDKRMQKQSMRSLIMQNFENYEETKAEKKVEFGTPTSRLAYQRVRATHPSKR